MPTPKTKTPKVKTFEVNIVYTVELVPDDKLIGTVEDEKRIWKQDYQNVFSGAEIKKFSLKVVK